MKKAHFLLAILLTCFTLAQAGFQNTDEAVQAANAFEKLVFSVAPNSQSYISFFDIDTDDGHLMVWVESSMFSVKKSSQNEIYRNLLDLWRETKYVKQKRYGNYLEILYQDPSKGMKTIKYVR